MDYLLRDRALPTHLNYAEVFEVADQITHLTLQVVGTEPKRDEMAPYATIRSIVNDLRSSNGSLGAALGSENWGELCHYHYDQCRPVAL